MPPIRTTTPAARSRHCAASEASARRPRLCLREVLYRRFTNRRQLASYVGLAPMPYQSGSMDWIGGSAGPATRGKDGHHPACLARLRYQPGSALAGWFRARVGALAGRTRRIAIVAMARAADRALALCPDRAAAGGASVSRHRRDCRWSDAIIGGDTGSATVFVIGSVKPPRFRWVVFCRGHASCMRHSGAGPATDPTACKVMQLRLRDNTALDPKLARRRWHRRANPHV